MALFQFTEHLLRPLPLSLDRLVRAVPPTRFIAFSGQNQLGVVSIEVSAILAGHADQFTTHFIFEIDTAALVEVLPAYQANTGFARDRRTGGDRANHEA